MCLFNAASVIVKGSLCNSASHYICRGSQRHNIPDGVETIGSFLWPNGLRQSKIKASLHNVNVVLSISVILMHSACNNLR